MTFDPYTDDGFMAAQDFYISHMDADPAFCTRVGNIQEAYMAQHGDDLHVAFVKAVNVAAT